ncbi:MAG: ABC transporter permease [Gemmataceae bacterium]
MRFTDVMGLALTALWQRRLRTTLTLLGVVFGTFVLAASLSLGRGVQDTILREYSRHSELRSIEVLPGFSTAGGVPEEELRIEGDVNAERRQRLRDALAERWQRFHGRTIVGMTAERIAELQRLDHVESVRPVIDNYGRAVHGKRWEQVRIVGADFENDRLRGRLVAGRMPAPGEDRSAVLTEAVLYLLGFHSDAEVDQALGRKVRVEYRIGGGVGQSPHLLLMLLQADSSSVGPEEEKVLNKVLAQLPAAIAGMDLSTQDKASIQKLLSRRLKLPSHRQGPERTFSEEYTLAGILRDAAGDERNRYYFQEMADVFLSPAAAQEFYFRAPQHKDHGFDRATVLVDRLENVKAVTETIKSTGLRAYSVMEQVERERFIYLLVFGGMTCIAVIALVVAALGIMNTMLIGVLERTREIGVMKAVGGRDGHILLMFLIEGALIGLLGGALGLLLSWLASFPGDAWVRSMVNRQLTLKLEESLFAFPWWLIGGAPLFAMVVTTLAALLPARRASRINPVEALRHE